MAQRWSATPKHYTVDDGLPTSDAYHIQQDRNGYIWIGTDVGVARFNGYDFDLFTMGDGLPNNNIIRIREDRRGRIWMNSIGPLCVLDNDVLQSYDIFDLKKPRRGFDFVESAEGGFWFNHGSRVMYIRPDFTSIPLPSHIAQPSTFGIRSIVPGKNDTVLICGSTQLYFTYNEKVLDSIALPKPFHQATDLCFAYTDEGVYFINADGLQYWSFKSGEIRVVDQQVNTGLELHVEGQQLFLIDPTYGLRIYNLQRKNYLLSQQFFPANFTNSYLLDFEGNLWITTLGNGVYFYPKQLVESNTAVLPRAHQRLNKLQIYRDKLVMGTFNGRIYTYESDTRSTELWIESTAPDNTTFDRVMDMDRMADGRLVLGKDTGLYIMDNDSLHRISSNVIKAVHADKNNGLTVLTSRGGFHLTAAQVAEWQRKPANNRKRMKATSTVITDSRGYSAFISSDGTIWADNTRQGLLSYNSGRITEWKTHSNIFGVHINEMLELPDSTMVFATHGEGLILMKNGDYWVINEVEQLPSNIVNALFLDGQSLWVATNRGVAQLKNIDLFKRQFSINVYNRNDGLLTEDIVDLVVWKNQLMLGTQLGLLILPLKQKATEEIHPRILLSTVEANGEEFETNKQLELRHNQNNLRFQFLGISFRSKGNVRYRYRLKGYDQDWASTSDREVLYHNLSPGAYEFEVQAIDYKGQVSASSAQIGFEIAPHFTQRTAFWVILTLLAIGLLIGGIHSYLSIRERNTLSTLVLEKTATLDRRVEELARSNEELEQFAHAASHDLRSPLRNVANFVQLLDRKAKDRLQVEEKEYIELAIRGVKGMEQTIDDLLKVARIDQYDENKEWLNFATIVEEIKEANYSLIEEQKASIVLESSFPDLLFSKVNAIQLLQNLILNGITYRSADTPIIRLSCHDKEQEWIFKVIDNGIGIAPEFQQKIFGLFHRLHHPKDIPGTGIGLAICKKIVERNGGKMGVQSEAGKGATFFFSIPKP
ncbi:MAG: ATP-binding protein [Bacteroidota bacterium]